MAVLSDCPQKAEEARNRICRSEAYAYDVAFLQKALSPRISTAKGLENQKSGDNSDRKIDPVTVGIVLRGVDCHLPSQAFDFSRILGSSLLILIVRFSSQVSESFGSYCSR